MPDPARKRRARLAAPLAVVAVVLFALMVRVRLSEVPLERDEGEYAYAGHLILDGVPPYRLAYNMKFPGTYYVYAVFLALFGETPRGIHLGLAFVNAASTLLVFFLGRRLLGDMAAAAAAAAAHAVLTIDRWVFGVFAHATHFVNLPVLAAWLVLLRALESGGAMGFLGAGVLLGIAVLMKQHAALYLPFAALVVLWGGWATPKRWRAVALLALGSVLPLLVLVVLFAAQGVLGNFWFWTFRYASEYVTVVPASMAKRLLAHGLSEVTTVTLPFWILGLLGLVSLWIPPRRGLAPLFTTGLAVASFLAVCPGFFFRGHYFIVLLPALALGCGAAVLAIERWGGRLLPVRAARFAALAVLAALVARYVSLEHAYLFSIGPKELSRARYGANPFVEAVDVAAYIRERTEPGERIVVLGSEPEIYFYSGRRSATGYIYTYPLMEPHAFASRMQDEMMREIEAADPAYLVFVKVSTSWLTRSTSDRRILDWTARYVEACYEPVGILDIYSLGATAVAWDEDLPGFRRRSDNLIVTYRRKGDASCTAPLPTAAR